MSGRPVESSLRPLCREHLGERAPLPVAHPMGSSALVDCSHERQYRERYWHVVRLVLSAVVALRPVNRWMR